MVKEYKDKISASGLEIAVISKGDEDDYIPLPISRVREILNFLLMLSRTGFETEAL